MVQGIRKSCLDASLVLSSFIHVTPTVNLKEGKAFEIEFKGSREKILKHLLQYKSISLFYAPLCLPPKVFPDHLSFFSSITTIINPSGVKNTHEEINGSHYRGRRKYIK